MKMTVAELIEALEDVEPSTEVKLALQPSYPMIGSILNICIERTKDDEDKTLWIACSDNEDYGCPRAVWGMDEIIDIKDED